MKLATFNVNGIRTRLPNLLAWLDKERPDVACLQELKAVDGDFPADELRAAGYHAIWKGQRSWNGVAILARGVAPVEIRRALPGDPPDEHSRYLEAAVDGVIVACLYLPNGNPWPGPKFDYKLAWFERFIRHAKDLYGSGHPVALLGDFNVVPTDHDIYNPKSWRRDALLQPESREAYARLLDQGWLDCLRHTHPTTAVYTFWDYFRQHWPLDKGLRIDHVLLNGPLAARLKGAGVDRWVRGEAHASDHAPVWVEIGGQRSSAAARAGSGVKGGLKTSSAKGAVAGKASVGEAPGNEASAKKAASAKKVAPARETATAKKSAVKKVVGEKPLLKKASAK